MIDINRIGIEIKNLRESMNISQAQFAELIDRTTATVGQYERAERYPSYKTLDIIFKRFGVDANPFFVRQAVAYVIDFF